MGRRVVSFDSFRAFAFPMWVTYNREMQGTKLARLWKHVTKDGRTYFSGPMTKITRLVVVENNRKKDSKDPDYYAYVVPNRGARPLDDRDLSSDPDDTDFE